MADYSYSTLARARAFHIINSRLPAFMVMALVVLAPLGLATPDPIISGRAAHTQEVAQ